ncbi:hypothetical protein BDN71DRAFT_1501842 [Pleurotus eryngii]|uniref:Uncharacterized protein n=1 Tax=Pleurotus eryngii TaxID=5323 RepID=A0A9P6A5S9_PLEER|nr:hypothetical protein BDN71DRAFT_1501842 [Pleurotus eryngii]
MSGPSQVSRLPTSSMKGLNYQVLGVAFGPSDILCDDEEHSLNSSTSLASTTGPQKLVPITQKLPVNRAPKRSPSTSKAARGLTHLELLSASEIHKPTGSLSPPQITVRAPFAPPGECAPNPLAPPGSTTGFQELCSGLTAPIISAQKTPRPPSFCMQVGPSAGPSKTSQRLSNTQTNGAALTAACARRFAPPSKEMLQLLVETELALLPNEVSSKRPRIQLQPPASVSQTTPPRSEVRTKESESRLTPTITQRHINTNSLFLRSHDASAALNVQAYQPLLSFAEYTPAALAYEGTTPGNLHARDKKKNPLGHRNENLVANLGPVSDSAHAVRAPLEAQGTPSASLPALGTRPPHHHHYRLKDMDAFTTIAAFFTTAPNAADASPAEIPPVDAETTGSGGGAYCVVA